MELQRFINFFISNLGTIVILGVLGYGTFKFLEWYLFMNGKEKLILWKNKILRRKDGKID